MICCKKLPFKENGVEKWFDFILKFTVGKAHHDAMQFLEVHPIVILI